VVCAAFGAVTLVALEGRDVVVLRTTAADGTTHETRTWIANDGGALLVEAANEDRPFLHDVRARPGLEVRRGDGVLRCTATALPNPEGHRRIRRLLAEKYGWADRWIALVADTSSSIAVRLDCAT
jgi:hypothetical protein